MNTNDEKEIRGEKVENLSPISFNSTLVEKIKTETDISTHYILWINIIIGKCINWINIFDNYMVTWHATFVSYFFRKKKIIKFKKLLKTKRNMKIKILYL